MAQQNLELTLMEKLERQKNEIGATWVKMGDRCNKEFFTFIINPNLNPKFLNFWTEKRTLNASEDIHNYIFCYYKVIYTRDNKVHNFGYNVFIMFMFPS